MTCGTDSFGNLTAWSRDGSGPGVLTGSHLDSVTDGGAYDGPLGVVSAFAALDLLAETGFTPRRPIGVAAFVEEEGSRFGPGLPRVPAGGRRDLVGAGAGAAGRRGDLAARRDGRRRHHPARR